MIKISFPDGSIREYAEGVTGYEIAKSISERLAQDVLACSVNGEIVELNRPINADASIKLHKWEDEEAKHAYWHTSAHLMAEALQAVVDYLFAEVGMNRIAARHDPNNPNSGRVMRKCGMEYEGTLRAADRNNQGICDAAHYAILRAQWKK